MVETTVQVPTLPLPELAEAVGRQVTLQPLNLEQLRDHWDVLGEAAPTFPELLTREALTVALSCGQSTEVVLRWFPAGDATRLVELAAQVRKLSGMAPKGDAAGEPGSP